MFLLFALFFLATSSFFTASVPLFHPDVVELPQASISSSPFSEPEMAGDENLARAMQSASAPVLEPQPVSREDYETALQLPAASYLGTTPSTTYEGLEIHFEEYDDFFPYIKLGVSLPVIPGIDRLKEEGAFDRTARLTVSHVFNRTGEDVYDPTHSFEQEPFNGIHLRPIEELPGYTEGERQIYVKKEVKESDLQTIQGQVVLELPVNVQPLEFDPTQLNQTKKTLGAEVSLQEFYLNSYTFDYVGPGKNFVKWIGYDAAGQVVPLGSYTADIPDALREPTPISVSFERPVSKIKLFVADEILIKNLPFTLKLGK